MKEFHVVLALLEHEHRKIFQAHAACCPASSEISHFSRDSGLLLLENSIRNRDLLLVFLVAFVMGLLPRTLSLEE